MSKQSCLIIGGGHAAAQLVASLIQLKWPGDISLVSDEPWLPYNRPPLSKSFLAGSKSVEELLIRPQASYDKFGVQCLLGEEVTKIEPGQGLAWLAGGRQLEFSHLALCTGGVARRLSLPGNELAGLHYLRRIEDVQSINNDLKPGSRVVIIGGGYIGLETAAMLRQLDHRVTILEAADRLLGRVTAPQMSDFFRQLHENQGVEVVTGAQVIELQGGDRVESVVCADGQLFDCDLVIAGIGLLPSTSLAETAGIAVEDGIIVDDYCRTSVSNVVAAGDCTRFHNKHYDRSMRLESVQNAVDQAKVAAAALCGIDRPYRDLPWFWSDQYSLKFQIAGLSQGFTDVVFRGNPNPGDLNECSFAAFYLRDDRVIAVDAANSPQSFMFGKRLVESGNKVEIDQLTDPEVSLKTLITG